MTYVEGAQLSGVILVQPFSEARVGSSEKTRIRLYKKLLGEDAYGRVEARRLQEQRVEWEDIWGELVAHGARVVLHENTKESAEGIVRGVMGLGGSVELLIQKELVANGGKLEKTSAGKQVDEDIGAEVTKLTDEIEALKKDGEAAAEEIKELQEKVVVCHENMEDLKRMC
ncbi:hypothetical protein B0T18DRAFT_466957 [Schizothecium vesticola]|uniref:Uncharacterized protein n=1 Tax=Schizothecium vesticola TaxID=314040 RepID=A0AA40EX62_9PEZI|nr:hypothetical protein B0T18DRAFT_466957 [Schizothecium vesticola]